MMTVGQARIELKSLVKNGSVNLYISTGDYRSCTVTHAHKSGRVIKQFNCTTFEECLDMLKDSLRTKLSLVK